MKKILKATVFIFDIAIYISLFCVFSLLIGSGYSFVIATVKIRSVNLQNSLIYLFIFVLIRVVITFFLKKIKYQPYKIKQNLYWLVPSSFFIFLSINILTAYLPISSRFEQIMWLVTIIEFIVTLIKFEYGLMMFVFLIPLINCLPVITGLETNYYPTLIILYCGFLSAWAINFFKKKIDLSFDREHIPVFLFLIIIIISGISSIFRYVGYHSVSWIVNNTYWHKQLYWTNFDVLKNYIVPLLLNLTFGISFFFIIYSFLIKKNIVNKIFFIFIITSFLFSMLGFLQYYNFIKIDTGMLQGNWRYETVRRLNATFTDPNAYAGYICLIIPLIFNFLVKRINPFFRIFVLIIFLFIILNLFLTGSRGSTFIFLFYSFIVTLFYFWKKKKIFLLFLIPLILFCVIIFKKLNISLPSIERFKMYPTISSRTIFYKVGYLLFKKFPDVGSGLGSYIIELPNYIINFRPPIAGYESDNACNFYLNLLTETGLIGLIFFLFIVYKISIKIINIFRFKEITDVTGIIGLSGSILNLFLLFLTGSYLLSYEVNFTFWLFIGMFYYLNRNVNS